MRSGKANSTVSGFTLMELLVVLVIIGLLAALVGPMVYQRIAPARASVARAQIDNLTRALDGFFVDTGRYPNSQEGLRALTARPDGVVKWKGPYLKKAVPPDPWGQPYRYRSPGTKGPFEIVSFGADGKPGGEDEDRDISNWSND